MAQEIKKGAFVFPEIVLVELVETRSSECLRWLKSQNPRILEETDELLERALVIKDLLGIAGDSYNLNGVGWNDIQIIVAAELSKSIMVTEEAPQKDLPKSKKKYKIPAVCKMSKIEVSEIMNFREVFISSKEVF